MRSPTRRRADRRVFLGRTGAGGDVEVWDVNGWLDVRYFEPRGEARGFSLNRLFAGELARALVGVLADRQEASR